MNHVTILTMKQTNILRKNNKVNIDEVNMIMRIGKRLGFAYDFCKGALKDILDNKYIVDVPPKFSNKGIAHGFIEESIELEVIDNEIEANELEWIGSVIKENEMEEEWNINQIENLYVHYETNNRIIEK